MDSQIRKKELDHKLNSYNYDLDPSLIASTPKRIRHESRMMVVRQVGSDISSYEDKLTENIIDELNNGDLIIVNDTKVMKARLNVQLSNGSLVELLILELVKDSIWLCLGKPAKKLKLNEFVKLFSKKINNSTIEPLLNWTFNLAFITFVSLTIIKSPLLSSSIIFSVSLSS